MATRKEYVQYVMEQLADAGEVRNRAMMGEYVLYYREKVFGGLYDDRLLIKPVPAARKLLPDAPLELPYEGAKEMLLVENMEDRAFLRALLEAMYDELPAPKPRKPKK